jgi:UDP-N-acetylmuramate--alanine ligase
MEADEYAKRFLELDPTHSIVTAIDPDHFDTYPDEDALMAGFRQFIESTVDTVVAHSEHRVREASGNFGGRIIYYGFGQAEEARDMWIERDGNGVARVMPLNVPISLKVIGDHNLLNALAAIAVCSRVGVPYAKGILALADFPGVLRRFEYIGKIGKDVLVYDDYGHHPVEIEATLMAARQQFPDHCILLVYEPHQAGRLMHLMNETAASLTKADRVVLLPVYVVRGREQERDILEATSEHLAEQVKKLGGSVNLVQNYDEAAATVKTMLEPKTLIITMGATDVWKVAQLLVSKG